MFSQEYGDIILVKMQEITESKQVEMEVREEEAGDMEEVEGKEEGSTHQGCQEEILDYGMLQEAEQRKRKEKLEKYNFRIFSYDINCFQMSVYLGISSISCWCFCFGVYSRAPLLKETALVQNIQV